MLPEDESEEPEPDVEEEKTEESEFCEVLGNELGQKAFYFVEKGGTLTEEHKKAISEALLKKWAGKTKVSDLQKSDKKVQGLTAKKAYLQQGITNLKGILAEYNAKMQRQRLMTQQSWNR
jgi:hypothetical protein